MDPLLAEGFADCNNVARVAQGPRGLSQTGGSDGGRKVLANSALPANVDVCKCKVHVFSIFQEHRKRCCAHCNLFTNQPLVEHCINCDREQRILDCPRPPTKCGRQILLNPQMGYDSPGVSAGIMYGAGGVFRVSLVVPRMRSGDAADLKLTPCAAP